MSFLDLRTFSTDDPDSRALYALLRELFDTDEAEVQQFVKSAGLAPGRIRWKRALFDIWIDVLTYAAAEGCLRVLIEAVAAHPEGVRVKVYLDSPPTAVARPPALPFGRHLVAGRRAMFDREGLRGQLRSLATVQGPRLLVVHGPKGSGKSHSWFLLADEQPPSGHLPWPCHLVDLDRHTSTLGPVEVMDLIIRQLGWAQVPVDPYADPANQAKFLFDGFAIQARQHGEPLVLVVDGFDAQSVSPEARSMLSEIARAVDRIELGHLRAVFADCAGVLVGRAGASREDLVFPTVEDVRQFFVGAAVEHGAELPDDLLDEMMVDLLGEGLTFTEDQLPDISHRAADMASTAFVAA